MKKIAIQENSATAWERYKQARNEVNNAIKGLFTWKWGTPGAWGTPAWWGSQRLHIFFVVYLVAFTCVVGYPTQPGNPSPRGGLPA